MNETSPPRAGGREPDATLKPYPNVELDEESHVYRVDGRISIGTNEPVAGLGLIDTSMFTQFHRDRGTAVHRAVELWLQGRLRWGSVDKVIFGRVRAAIRFIEDYKLVVAPENIERILHSKKHGFCGRPDIADAAILDDPSRLVVVDWKSGVINPVTGMLTAGYELLCSENFDNAGRIPRRRIGVQLKEDGYYKPHEFTDHRDERRFLSALDLFRTFKWKGEKHGKPADNPTA